MDVTLLTCSVAADAAPAGAVDFRALAWRPSLNGEAPGWVVPPLVEIIDYLEEEEFSALHTDSAAAQGLVTLAAARLLHLPVTGAVDPDGLRAPDGPGDLTGRLRRRYRAWFYGRLDEAFVPTPAAARALVAAGVEPSRVTLLPAAPGENARGRPELSRPAGGTASPLARSSSDEHRDVGAQVLAHAHLVAAVFRREVTVERRTVVVPADLVFWLGGLHGASFLHSASARSA